MDELTRQANNIINSQDIKIALEDLRNYYLEDVSLTAMAMYENLIEVGFTEVQAFDVAKAYILEFCQLEFID